MTCRLFFIAHTTSTVAPLNPCTSLPTPPSRKIRSPGTSWKRKVSVICQGSLLGIVITWLVVSTHLKNNSQNRINMKQIWNHHLVTHWIGNPYNGSIKPDYLFDDHPLPQGTNGSLVSSTYVSTFVSDRTPAYKWPFNFPFKKKQENDPFDRGTSEGG